MKRQEQKRAVQAIRAELTELRLGALEERALLFGITSDLVYAALDDEVDAKRALIELCISVEFGACVHEDITQSPSPLPNISLSTRPSTPTRFSPDTQPGMTPLPLQTMGQVTTGFTAATNSPSGGHLDPPPFPTAKARGARASTPPRLVSAPVAVTPSPRVSTSSSSPLAKRVSSRSWTSPPPILRRQQRP